nr:MAG TPA: hypothetical protein [Caudoviricetes sp.]
MLKFSLLKQKTKRFVKHKIHKSPCCLYTLRLI